MGELQSKSSFDPEDWISGLIGSVPIIVIAYVIAIGHKGFALHP